MSGERAEAAAGGRPVGQAQRTPSERPADALAELAAELRDDPVIAPFVADPAEPPVLGLLAAAGPRAAEAPATYTLLFEAIREGFLLHYGRSRLLDAADPDLRLLAGDYLYALGLERLAARGDLAAVHELGDLISLSAQLHARAEEPAELERSLGALWLAAAVAIGCGEAAGHERAKAALRDGDPKAAVLLIAAARESAGLRLRGPLDEAAESIGFAAEHHPDRG